jgi:hypothetical protein
MPAELPEEIRPAEEELPEEEPTEGPWPEAADPLDEPEPELLEREGTGTLL